MKKLSEHIVESFDESINEAAYKPKKFNQGELTIGLSKTYLYEFSNGKARVTIESIENNIVTFYQVRWGTYKYEKFGKPFTNAIDTFMDRIKSEQLEIHTKEEIKNAYIHDLRNAISFKKIKGGILSENKVINELETVLKKLAEHEKNVDSASTGGQYYGGTQLFASRSGIAIDVDTNDVHRGSGGSNVPFLVQVKIGGNLPSERQSALKIVLNDVLSKYSYSSEYGVSYLKDSDGTNWSSVFITCPQNSKSYHTIPSLDKLRSIRSS